MKPEDIANGTKEYLLQVAVPIPAIRNFSLRFLA
jgi:hypothetical protein